MDNSIKFDIIDKIDLRLKKVSLAVILTAIGAALLCSCLVDKFAFSSDVIFDKMKLFIQIDRGTYTVVSDNSVYMGENFCAAVTDIFDGGSQTDITLNITNTSSRDVIVTANDANIYILKKGTANLSERCRLKDFGEIKLNKGQSVQIILSAASLPEDFSLDEYTVSAAFCMPHAFETAEIVVNA